MRLFRIFSSIRSSLWFVPVVCVLAGMLLSFGTTAIDRQVGYDLIPRALTGGPDAAVAILSTVAASMVSLAALVLTITMVVVQLAMGQFSPRIVQRILQDKPSQGAIGIFVGTFAHAMLALREVRFGGGGQVPGLAVIVAYVLVVISIVTLVMYVHHIGRSLRVSALIELVGEDTRDLLEKLYPDRGPEPEPEPDGRRVVRAPTSGVVTKIGHDTLVTIAKEGSCVLELVPALGEFVPADAPLFEVHGEPVDLDEKGAIGGIVLGLERTLDQDVAFGLRMLVDIAERSLSDSPFLDPTTAVQALDRLHDCLRQLARRPFPNGLHHDANGELRLMVRSMDWDAYVHLAFDEIRMAGAGSPQIARRMKASLLDLMTVAPDARQEVLASQLELLTAATKAAMTDDRDVELALEPDRQGLGVAVGTRSV